MQERPTRMLRYAQVLDRVGLSKSEWQRRVKLGDAPAPVALGPKLRAWRESDVERYLGALATVPPGERTPVRLRSKDASAASA